MWTSSFRLLLAICLAFQVNGDLEGRISGGYEVRSRDQAPYNALVALRVQPSDGRVTVCSAVMYNAEYLITSGHCLLSLASINATAVAVVGERELFMEDPGEQVINIKSFKVHYGYNRMNGDDNIGLIQLARPAVLSKYVQPAIPMEEDPTAYGDIDQSCQIMGWGNFVDNGRPINSRILRYSKITVFGDMVSYVLSTLKTGFRQPKGTVYGETYYNVFPDTSEYTSKACLFDIGGMVSCVRNGKHVMRGVVSDSNCNFKEKLPVVIMDTSRYMGWVKECVKDWNNCLSI